jgi:hypothetical protein
MEISPTDTYTRITNRIVVSNANPGLLDVGLFSLFDGLVFELCQSSTVQKDGLAAKVALEKAAAMDRQSIKELRNIITEISLPSQDDLRCQYPNLIKNIKHISQKNKLEMMFCSHSSHDAGHVSEVEGWVFDYRDAAPENDFAFLYAIDQGYWCGCHYWLGSNPTRYYRVLNGQINGYPPVYPPLIGFAYSFDD